MGKLTKEEQEKLFNEIDQVAKNKKYSKNWRVTSHGEQNENGEFVEVSYLPDIFKMIGEDLGILTLAENMKHTKVKAFGRSGIRRNVKKNESTGKYDIFSAGTASYHNVYDNDEQRLAKKSQKTGKPHLKAGQTFLERRINLSQFNFDVENFDFDEMQLSLLKNNAPMDKWRQEEVSGQNQVLEQELFDNQAVFLHQQKLSQNTSVWRARKHLLDMTHEEEAKTLFENYKKKKEHELKQNPKAFKKWLDSNPEKNDLDFRKELAILRAEQKKKRTLLESKLDEATKKQAEFEKQIKTAPKNMQTVARPVDSRIADGMKFLKMAGLLEEVQNFDNYKNSDDMKGKMVCVHEVFHTLAVHENLNFMGGINVRENRNLHEGMTEWLARKIITNHKDEFLTESQKQQNQKPRFWSYEGEVAFADIIDNLFSGSIEDVYINGTKSKANYVSKSVNYSFEKNGKTHQKPFGFEAFEMFFEPIQKIVKLENEKRENNPNFDEDFCNIQKKEELKKLHKNFCVIKKCAKQMVENHEISAGNLQKITNDLFVCWEKFGGPTFFLPVKFDEPECLEEKFTIADGLNKTGFLAEQIAMGSVPFFRAMGQPFLANFLKGKVKMLNGEFFVDDKQLDKNEMLKVFDPNFEALKIPDFVVLGSDKGPSDIFVDKFLLFLPNKFAGEIFDNSKTKELQKTFAGNKFNSNFLVLKNGVVANCSKPGCLEMNGINTSGAMLVKIAKNKKMLCKKVVFKKENEKDLTKAFESCSYSKNTNCTNEQVKAITNLAKLFNIKTQNLCFEYDKDKSFEVLLEKVKKSENDLKEKQTKQLPKNAEEQKKEAFEKAGLTDNSFLNRLVKPQKQTASEKSEQSKNTQPPKPQSFGQTN